MNQARILDLESLAAPIAGTTPVGPNLRAQNSPQSLYTRLKDARAAARDAERKADSAEVPSNTQLPQWQDVVKLSYEALQTQSKDLEVACWLTEALVRTEGFAGLRAGLELVHQLLLRYGEKLGSMNGDEGIITFLQPLTNLNGLDGDGTLIQPIRKTLLTVGAPGPFAAYQYHQAAALAKVTDKAVRERRLAAGIPTLEQFEQAVRASPVEFLRRLLTELRGCLAALETLQTLCAKNWGPDAPPTTRIRSELEQVAEILSPYTAGLLPLEKVTVIDASPATTVPHGANGESRAQTPMSSNPVADREEALRTLAKVAAYFRVAEPHSPIAFALDDLIRRARMTLPELLAELLPDANARRTFLTSAGIRPDATPAPANAAPQKT
jgi:type VI secretion system protein ImpA